ncbi:hypothetical protein [Nostoc sp. CCY 9925]|uniref:hypothetical protein n=1 Tax=Nostoc sp. CCY 9925 TaxID=3103865 RepID=UPI0039C686E1
MLQLVAFHRLSKSCYTNEDWDRVAVSCGISGNDAAVWGAGVGFMSVQTLEMVK